MLDKYKKYKTRVQKQHTKLKKKGNKYKTRIQIYDKNNTRSLYMTTKKRNKTCWTSLRNIRQQQPQKTRIRHVRQD